MGNRPVLTDKNKIIFLDHLRKTCNVSASARLIGYDRRSAYRARDTDEEFAAQWDDALEEGLDAREAEVGRRAFEGVEEPVVYQGSLTPVYERDENGNIVMAVEVVADPLAGDIEQRVPVQARNDDGSLKWLTIKKYSDGLAMFFLKAYRERFRDKSEVDVNLKGDLAARILQSRQRAGAK